MAESKNLLRAVRLHISAGIKKRQVKKTPPKLHVDAHRKAIQKKSAELASR
jgi:hypothetical protein